MVLQEMEPLGPHPIAVVPLVLAQALVVALVVVPRVQEPVAAGSPVAALEGLARPVVRNMPAVEATS